MRKGLIGVLLGVVSSAVIASWMEHPGTVVTKWGTAIKPLPAGATLLEESSDRFQWKRRWQQLVPDGTVVEYCETDDRFGHKIVSQIIKK